MSVAFDIRNPVQTTETHSSTLTRQSLLRCHSAAAPRRHLQPACQREKTTPARRQTPPRVSPCLRTACSSDAPTPTVALAAYQLAAYPSIPAAARAIPAAASGVQCRPGQPATMVFLVPSCRAGWPSSSACCAAARRVALQLHQRVGTNPSPLRSRRTHRGQRCPRPVAPTSRRDVDCHTARGRGNVTVRACLIRATRSKPPCLLS